MLVDSWVSLVEQWKHPVPMQKTSVMQTRKDAAPLIGHMFRQNHSPCLKSFFNDQIFVDFSNSEPYHPKQGINHKHANRKPCHPAAHFYCSCFVALVCVPAAMQQHSYCTQQHSVASSSEVHEPNGKRVILFFRDDCVYRLPNKQQQLVFQLGENSTVLPNRCRL